MRIGQRGEREKKNKEKKDDRVEVKKRSKDRQKKRRNGAKLQELKTESGWMKSRRGVLRVKGARLSSHLASLCLLPSFPSSRFLSLPIPVEIT